MKSPHHDNLLATPSLTGAELHSVLGGRLVTHGTTNVSAACRVAIDSRQVQPGDLFWALRGEQHDGADFADEAFARGAVGIVSGPQAVDPPEGAWALCVDDSLAALKRLAQHRRHHFYRPVIGVTGSVGKTTTRQMIFAALSAAMSGTASPENYNTPVGLSLSLLGLNSNLDFGVFEMAARGPGQIAELSGLAAPTIGVITNIGVAHLGPFGSQRAIAETKAELLESLPADGLAVLNGDDPWLRRMAGRSRAEVLWVGRSGDCQVTATNVSAGGGRLRFEVDGHALQVPVWGRHHLTAALIGVAVARAMGLPFDLIAEGLSTFRAPPMRCEVARINGVTVINDTYNASPPSMRAALELLRESETAGQRVFVCGDMAELGEAVAELHRSLGRDVVSTCGPDLLVACGRHADDVVDAARAAGMPADRTRICQTPEEALPQLRAALVPGDVVLVKGSRRMALERLVEALGWPSQPAPTEEAPTVNQLAEEDCVTN